MLGSQARRASLAMGSNPNLIPKRVPRVGWLAVAPLPSTSEPALRVNADCTKAPGRNVEAVRRRVSTPLVLASATRVPLSAVRSAPPARSDYGRGRFAVMDRLSLQSPRKVIVLRRRTVYGASSGEPVPGHERRPRFLAIHAGRVGHPHGSVRHGPPDCQLPPTQTGGRASRRAPIRNFRKTLRSVRGGYYAGQ